MSRATTPERRLSLLLLLVAASQRMGQLVDRELSAEGVDAADYALLSLVGVRGPVRLTEAAAELGMPLTTASDAIRRLEAGGRVERLAEPRGRPIVALPAQREGRYRVAARLACARRIDRASTGARRS